VTSASGIVGRAAPFVLSALVVLQCGRFIASTSGTADETWYLQMAEAAIHGGDTAEFAVRGVAPLPILLQYALPAAGLLPDYAQKILLARMSAVALIAVPLVLVVYFWLAGEAGAGPAAAAAAVVALSPSVVAHSAIAATDACFVLCALLSLWALARYVDRPSWSRRLALIAAGALAFSAKYSAVELLGVAAIVLAWMDRPQRAMWRRLGTAGAIAVSIAAAGIAVTWPFHPIAGLQSQINHQRLGHEAYLLGQRGNSGWWYYHPIALAVKSTYVELAACVVALAAFGGMFRPRSTVTRVWGVAAALVLGSSMIGHVSIGVRYVLLVVPLAVMTATVWLMHATERRRWIALATGLAAVAAQAATSVAIAPRYLSYFNGFAGGPMNGYRWLADSNLDWGQDLPAMRRALARVGAREPIASYFGTAPLAAYGVNAWAWEIAGPDVKARTDWIVISATHLVGLYVPNDRFRAFRALAPFARPTPALFLYDASRPEVKAAIADATARGQ